MAEEGSTNFFYPQTQTQSLPVFWSLSPTHLGSRSEPDYEEMDSSGFLSLGLGFHDRSQDRITDWAGEDFFIGRLSVSGSESNSEFSRARPVDLDGLRILGFESDSDYDEQIVAIGGDSILNDQIQAQALGEMQNASIDLNVPLCWDCLRINEDNRRDDNVIEEFEWEEIDAGFEEREVIDIDINQEPDQDETESNVEWEVLLTTNRLENHEDVDSYSDEGFVYTTSEYDEVLFAQFHENHDGSMKGSPPAAKLAVENLPSFVLTKEDFDNKVGTFSCAVCKDEFLVDEKAKRLPCSHCYHEECILPWLEMRNTCPLCRYELPTDDPEYENRKARRARNSEEEMVRYDFEILPEA